jgi:predicted LPLAT superfamily acyltransferase
MRRLFYTSLAFISNILGPWVFVLLSRGVAAGYFFLFPARVRVGIRFYGALFPARSRFFHWVCTWRQFQNFTSVFLDRFLLQTGHDIHYTFEGRKHLLEAMDKNTGGIVLMSHIGNWEIAARLLRRSIPDLPLMLFMGQRAKDEIERLQKKDLMASGIRVLAVDQAAGSPFSLVEGLSFLKSGGFVSLAGDMVWDKNQRVLPVTFLGHRARLPETAHALALVSGAPLFIFFASKRGRSRFHFKISEPLYVRAGNRSLRSQAIQGSAQVYADLMEAHVHCFPYEWYHFEPFLRTGCASDSNGDDG